MKLTGFLPGIFSGESIVMQISFVMLLFSDQISRGGKSFQGGGGGGRPDSSSIVSCRNLLVYFVDTGKFLFKKFYHHQLPVTMISTLPVHNTANEYNERYHPHPKTDKVHSPPVINTLTYP